jgi:prenyltransferase beta subunit
VSWPLASFLLVAVGLALGWLYYERARPSARMVAVVATLAAVAALGRDAFVALPDVKPITAMTLVVGYALGPLQGFSVGALGMFVSNILLGQGPYTPWQMAAWGMVGLGGAALGRLTGRRLGRFGLALACALAAGAAKEIMNLYTWTIGASHTPAALLATAGAAAPFDITDAVASLLFGLAFGPELARLLGRMRSRMGITWVRDDPPARPRGGGPRVRPAGPPGPLGGRGRLGTPRALSIAGATIAATALASLAGLGPHEIARAHPVPAERPAATPPAKASVSLAPQVSYLVGAQNSDGGFGAARGQRSSELFTAWSAMGLAAAGRSPAKLRRGGHSVLDSLLREASTLSGLGDDERTILAARACGASAYSFAGANLVAQVLRAQRGDGSFNRQVNLTAFAIFALRAVGHSAAFSPIRRGAGWIERQQNVDGGFSFSVRGTPSDVDDTGAALQALVDARARNARALAAALGFLLRSQRPDGGYPQRTGSESNAQSTAWAVQGLLASGRDPATVSRHGSRSPLAYLQSLTAPDGSVHYSRTSAQTPVWVTAQALIALARRTFPV